jgi:hypothetical protein
MKIPQKTKHSEENGSRFPKCNLLIIFILFYYAIIIGTNQNLIQEEVKRRLNSGNVCYHMVQNLLSSWLLLKNVKVRIYKTIILPMVLYGCETWSLILREEHILRVFENKVLRRIFGPKRDGVMGGWRKQHKEELHNLYSSSSIIRINKPQRMRWAGHVARMGEKRNVYRLLVGKPERKRPLGRPRHRWIDNIKMDLLEIRLGVVGWIGLAQDRTGQSSCELSNKPLRSIKCWETTDWLLNLWPLEWYTAPQS